MITGEGTFDMRTFEGKLVYFVLERCRYYRKPCIVVTGKNLVPPSKWKDLGVLFVFETKEGNLSFEEIRIKGLGPKLLSEVGSNIAQFMKKNNPPFP